jgi:ubiquitin carboxyl-terminal hydrolase 8
MPSRPTTADNPIQPPIIPPKPHQQQSFNYSSPQSIANNGGNQNLVPNLPPKPFVGTSNLKITQSPIPPPLMPKPKIADNRERLPPPISSKPSEQPVLIRGQNPMLLPTSPLQSSALFGVSGLRNLGNTCFMNSTIQCLSATIPLARYFLVGSYRRHIAKNNPLSSKGKVADSYAKLIQSMWSRDESVVVPSDFKYLIGELNPSFSGNDQHDSQEFLSFLLDQLHEDLNIAKRPFPPNGAELDSEDYPEHQFMEMEWKKYSMRNWSIIVDMFQGITKSRLQCLSCGKVLNQIYIDFDHI